MSVEGVLIGIDVGTTRLKAAAFSPQGRLIALETRDTPTLRLEGGGAEYEPEAVWDGVAECVAQCISGVVARVSGAVIGVGVASMAEAGLPVGRDGQPRRNAIAWFDPRSAPQAEAITARLGQGAIHARTGLFAAPKHGLAKLLWLGEHDPDALRGATWLGMAEYVALRLTGAFATCPTLAARTLAFDLERGAWAADWLSALGLPTDLLPDVLPEGAPLGPVTADAARRTGLPLGVPVALAGHDHPCAALGAGVTVDGELLVSTGTAEAVIGALGRARLDDAGLKARTLEARISLGPLPAPGVYGLQAGASASGGSVEWLRREVLGVTREAFESLVAGSDDPSGVLFVPHLLGSGPPDAEPLARGAFLGLDPGSSRERLARAVLEGTCFELRRIIEAMEGVRGRFSRCVVTGGHARSAAWLRLKASILGRALELPDVPEATLLGAALLGGVAGGAFRDAFDAGRAPERSSLTLEPTNHEVYEPWFTAYNRAVNALRPTFLAWPDAP